MRKKLAASIQAGWLKHIQGGAGERERQLARLLVAARRFQAVQRQPRRRSAQQAAPHAGGNAAPHHHLPLNVGRAGTTPEKHYIWIPLYRKQPCCLGLCQGGGATWARRGKQLAHLERCIRWELAGCIEGREGRREDSICGGARAEDACAGGGETCAPTAAAAPAAHL